MYLDMSPIGTACHCQRCESLERYRKNYRQISIFIKLLNK